MSTAKHSKLIILGSGPAGYTAAVLCRTCQPETGIDYRDGKGRAVDHHHRGRELAR